MGSAVERRVAHRDHVGNAAGDKAAQDAPAAAKREAPADAFNSALATAVLWGRWVVDYAETWDAHDQEDKDMGAEAVEDDGEPFPEKMARLTKQLNVQFEEGGRLEKVIRKNLRGLGFGEE